MIAYIRGKILHKSTSYIIVESGTIGYKINTGNFPKGEIGDGVELYCYHHIREDADELFGFEQSGDLEIFEKLITVSGVGPKVGQLILTQLGREKIITAVQQNDINLLKSIPGVGTKVAAKIIVELKSKLSKDKLDLNSLEDDETVDALIVLGLKKAEIIPALKEIPAELVDVQSRVKFVLKHVAGK